MVRLRKHLPRLTAILVVLAIIQVLCVPGGAAGAPPQGRAVPKHLGAERTPAFVPGEVIVKFKDEEVKGKSCAAAAVDFAAAHAALGLAPARTLPHGAVLFKTAADVPQAVAELKRDPRVEYAQPNFVFRAALPNDPLLGMQWGLTDAVYGVGAEQAWQYTQGSPGVVVAVLDSGVDYNHPDLAGRVAKGYDFVNSDGDPMDDNGHGTHVAGIIAAVTNNDEGIAGIAPGVKIMAVKVLDAAGVGTTSTIVSGIDYAAQHGARVVNMSFGSYEFDRLQYDAIKAHPEILFVAAAGNGGPDGVGDDNDKTPVYPANYCKENLVDGTTYPALPNIVSVAALAESRSNPGFLAGFSNYGASSVGLAAPGENIMSTVPAPPADGGVALAVYDAVYGYRVMFWGFGAEDLATPEAVYDSIVRTVYGFLGITPAETQTKPLLLVDDDQSGTYGTPPDDFTLLDVSSYYCNALSIAGYVYTLYTVRNGDNGPAVDATVYSGVVWFTGHAWCSDPGTGKLPNLTLSDRDRLAQYLKAGGRLFLSGADAGWLIDYTDFYTEYLRARLVNEWQGPSVLEGVYEPFTESTYRLSPFNVLDPRWIDILAPNGDGARTVLSYLPYEAWSGTSMAAPFVSGAAALALSLRGDLPPAQVIGILKDQVTPLPALAAKVASGGTLNAA
ncbi:MAG: Peptidase S8 and S53 subtilisin kexin sedolisin, partial [Clostridia bacterium 62_21]